MGPAGNTSADWSDSSSLFSLAPAQADDGRGLQVDVDVPSIHEVSALTSSTGMRALISAVNQPFPGQLALLPTGFRSTGRSGPGRTRSTPAQIRPIHRPKHTCADRRKLPVDASDHAQPRCVQHLSQGCTQRRVEHERPSDRLGHPPLGRRPTTARRPSTRPYGRLAGRRPRRSREMSHTRSGGGTRTLSTIHDRPARTSGGPQVEVARPGAPTSGCSRRSGDTCAVTTRSGRRWPTQPSTPFSSASCLGSSRPIPPIGAPGHEAEIDRVARPTHLSRPWSHPGDGTTQHRHRTHCDRTWCFRGATPEAPGALSAAAWTAEWSAACIRRC